MAHLKVVHIIPALFGEGGVLGGAERYALELARHMAEVVPTSMVSFGDEDREETDGRLRVCTLGKPWHIRGERANPFAFRLLGELQRADVVHCHQQHLVMSSAAALWCRVTGRRVFVSDLGGGGWDVSAYVSTDRWYHGHLHISEYSRKVSGHDGKPWARVILGGVDGGRFAPDDRSSKDGSVLYVGRLLPHKGVHDLVAALPDDLRLELIGQPYDAEYHQALLRLAAGKRVIFRHDCDDADLVQAYRKAFCIVLPSVYRSLYGGQSKVPELLGQTLLEGMACGLPAICTDVASLPEVVVEGVTGFLVPPNDPGALRDRLLWLREHPCEAKAMGAAGRQRVLEKFTWPAVVERCLAAYQAA